MNILPIEVHIALLLLASWLFLQFVWQSAFTNVTFGCGSFLRALDGTAVYVCAYVWNWDFQQPVFNALLLGPPVAPFPQHIRHVKGASNRLKCYGWVHNVNIVWWAHKQMETQIAGLFAEKTHVLLLLLQSESSWSWGHTKQSARQFHPTDCWCTLICFSVLLHPPPSSCPWHELHFTTCMLHLWLEQIPWGYQGLTVFSRKISSNINDLFLINTSKMEASALTG